MKRSMRSAMMVTTHLVPCQSMFERARQAPTQKLQQEIARILETADKKLPDQVQAP